MRYFMDSEKIILIVVETTGDGDIIGTPENMLFFQ